MCGMTRGGRADAEGFGVLAATHLRTWGRPGPAIPVWTTRSRFIVGNFAAARKRDRPRLYQWGPEGLQATGGHQVEPLPRDRIFRPPSIFLRRGGSTSTRPV